MSIESAREALRSSTPVVAVEAPAGCGKTHEATLAAVDLSKDLDRGQEVLLLAHTNAAVQEFRARARSYRARVRSMTLDAFAMELLTPHSRAVGLPTPLRVFGAGAVQFEALAPKLVELFRRAPSLARAVGRHYPVILFDEHQDARSSQHSIASALVRSGAVRVRYLGDPMQAIYDFAGPDSVDWTSILGESGRVEELDEPHRWTKCPRLGEWVMEARRALRTGGSISLRDLPLEVRVHHVPELDGKGHPNSRTVPRELIRPLNSVLNHLLDVGAGPKSKTCVLVGSNETTRAIRSASSRRLAIYEGADASRASLALERAIELKDNPRDLALLAIDVLTETATGCTAAFRAQISAALRIDGIELRRQRRYLKLLREFSRLYVTPDVSTWCSVLAAIGSAPPDGILVDLPECFRVLVRVAAVDDPDPRCGLERVMQARKESGHVPQRCVSTIHKAKGREFDNVIIPTCGASFFPDTERARRLLYVAISRAAGTLTLLLPGTRLSPLFAA